MLFLLHNFPCASQNENWLSLDLEASRLAFCADDSILPTQGAKACEQEESSARQTCRKRPTKEATNVACIALDGQI